MPITNVAQLAQAADQANRLIQEISDYLNQHPEHERTGRVRFPIGFLPTVTQHRNKLAFIPGYRIRTNLAYAIMTHDVLRWMVTRTTIGGQARDMLIKEAICIIGSVCETISIWPGQRGLGKSKSYADRMARLRELEVIDDEAETDLNWVWEIRCREHIAGVAVQEWNHYLMEHWTRSVAAYKSLRDGLREWREA